MLNNERRKRNKSWEVIDVEVGNDEEEDTEATLVGAEERRSDDDKLAEVSGGGWEDNVVEFDNSSLFEDATLLLMVKV